MQLIRKFAYFCDTQHFKIIIRNKNDNIPRCIRFYIISGTYKISRDNASESIKNGLVMVNYLEILSPSKLLKEGDIISLRGYGKAKLVSIGNVSKKGRFFISLEKMI